MALYLTSFGYLVTIADTCTSGLEHFYNIHPDIVLLDINVHDEDGREVCREITTNGEFKHIPVILVSGNNTALLTFEDYGTNDIIEKPFDFTKLEQKVSTYLASA